MSLRDEIEPYKVNGPTVEKISRCSIEFNEPCVYKLIKFNKIMIFFSSAELKLLKIS